MKLTKVVIFQVALCVLMLGFGTTLHAGGGSKQERFSLYFHGSTPCYKLVRFYYADITMTFDGQRVMEKRFFSTSAFGGATVSPVDVDGKMYVKMKVYDGRDNKLQKEHDWTRKLKQGENMFSLAGEPRYWGIYMDLHRRGDDVEVIFR